MITVAYERARADAHARVRFRTRIVTARITVPHLSLQYKKPSVERRSTAVAFAREIVTKNRPVRVRFVDKKKKILINFFFFTFNRRYGEATRRAD